MSLTLHEQLAKHIEDPEEYSNVFPQKDWTIDQDREMFEYIGKGWLVQSSDSYGFIVNPDWEGEPMWEPEEEEFIRYYEVQVEDEDGDTIFIDEHFKTREEAVVYIKEHHKEDVENEEITVNIVYWRCEEGGDIEEYEEEEEEEKRDYWGASNGVIYLKYATEEYMEMNFDEWGWFSELKDDRE